MSKKNKQRRQALTDGSGQWFDLNTADAWEEVEYFDGRNTINLHTGSQWSHEMLYRTQGGRWIHHTWSQYEGSRETYEEITEVDAAKWLVIAGEDPPKILKDVFAGLQIK